MQRWRQSSNLVDHIPPRSLRSKYGLPWVSGRLTLTALELTYDETGEGWKRHMMYGVAKLFDHFGPDICQSAQLGGLYNDVRLFEISRAALLTQPTFLSRSAWRDTNSRAQSDLTGSELLEDVFDVMLGCTDLGHRHATCKHSFLAWLIID